MMILSRSTLGGFCASASHPVFNLTHGFSKHAGSNVETPHGINADLTLNHS